MIWIKLLGMWIFSDSFFTIHTYWGKEGFKEHYIRIIRLLCGIGLMIWG